jgi:leucyl-tRNA synthetase
MSMGPLDASRPWNTRDVVGMQRFLQRLWRNLVDEDSGALKVSNDAAPDELRRALHVCIHGVRDDMDGLRFNTAISKLIELNNALTQHVTATGATPRDIAEPLVQMLAPLCPHLACELWDRLGCSDDVVYSTFPEADPSLLVSDTIEIPVQVNGKVRSRVTAPADVTDEALRELALADDATQKAIAGKTVRNVVIVPKRLVNVVVS